MKQVLSLCTPLALLVISGGLLFSLRESLEGLPGVIPMLWIGWFVIFVGSLIQAIEDAHDRERGARP